MRFSVNAQLGARDGDGDGHGEFSFALLGPRELAVRTFDPTRDVQTGAAVLDQRIHSMLAELRDLDLAMEEQPAFGRMFGALARAATRIVVERQFPEGTQPTEKEFQAELLKRLVMATELGGRITEHAWQGGGPTDLVS